MKHIVIRKAFSAGLAAAVGLSLSLPAGVAQAVGPELTAQDAATSADTFDEAALAQATEALRQARAAEAQAQEDLKTAQADETGAESAVGAAQAGLAQAQGAAEKPAAAVSNAQAEQQAAAQDLDAAQAAEQAADEKLQEAYADVEEAQEAQADAEEAVEQAETQAEESINTRTRAVSARAAASSGKSRAEEALAKGSYGFFEYEESNFSNASQALSAFSTAKYKSFTNIGASDDATSLDNLRATLQFMRECNAIRAKDGLSELKVTHYLMAVAELNLNWSAINVGHSHQFSSDEVGYDLAVGENLAWGYGTAAYDMDDSLVTHANPFEGWYDKEKALCLGGETDQNVIGHYLNIIKSDCLTTGFAYRANSSDPYPTSFGQTFQTRATGPAYTVDRYEQRLDTYCSEMQKLLDAYEQAQKEMEEAEAAYLQSQAQLEANQAQLEAAKQAVVQAQADAAAAKQAFVDAQGDTAAKQTALDAANAALAQAQEALAPLQAAVSAAQADVAAKQEALEKCKRATEDAKNAVEVTRAAATEAQLARYKLLPSVNNATLTGVKASYTYQLGEIMPAAKLAYKGANLVEGRDYNLAYVENDRVGTAKLKVSGSEISDDATFQGEFTHSFKIVPKGVSVKKLTKGKGLFKATWKQQRVETTGYQLRYSLKKTMKSAKVKTLASPNYASFTQRGLKSKKKYYVQLRTYKTVGSKTYYSSWSAKKSVKTN